MDTERLNEIGDRFIEAWNSQDVERVVGCYTDDLFYLDPNTRGPVVSADGMDLIVIEDDRIKRNEVYFDRAVLAPLLATADATA